MKTYLVEYEKTASTRIKADGYRNKKGFINFYIEWPEEIDGEIVNFKDTLASFKADSVVMIKLIHRD